jgi:hypothetical protein
MNERVAAKLSDSAFDFRRVVWPQVRAWLPPGVYIPVEDAEDVEALRAAPRAGAHRVEDIALGAHRSRPGPARCRYVPGGAPSRRGRGGMIDVAGAEILMQEVTKRFVLGSKQEIH